MGGGGEEVGKCRVRWWGTRSCSIVEILLYHTYAKIKTLSHRLAICPVRLLLPSSWAIRVRRVSRTVFYTVAFTLLTTITTILYQL